MYDVTIDSGRVWHQNSYSPLANFGCTEVEPGCLATTSALGAYSPQPKSRSSTLFVALSIVAGCDDPE